MPTLTLKTYQASALQSLESAPRRRAAAPRGGMSKVSK